MSDQLINNQHGQCASCKKPLQGRFCHECGERKLEHKDHSLASSLIEFGVSFTELDGKFWSSFKYLITRPGKLTHDYLSGRRVGQMSPFRILISTKIFYFLVITLFAQSILTTPLKTHVTAYNFLHQPLAKKMVDERLENRGISFKELEEQFDEMTEKQAKTLTFFMVPLLFIFVSILMYFLGGYGIKNLIFSTHFVSFMLIVLALVVPVMHGSFKLLGTYTSLDIRQSGWGELYFSLVLFAIYWLYFYVAVKTVYAMNWKKALPISILLAFSVYWVFLLYRTVLFFTTFTAI